MNKPVAAVGFFVGEGVEATTGAASVRVRVSIRVHYLCHYRNSDHKYDKNDI
jgi:hypothetical protein